MKVNDQVCEINDILKKEAPQIFEMLSERGRMCFFPKKGILAQAAQAKGKKINATIGVALDDSGEPLSMSVITENSKLSPSETVLYSPSYGQMALAERWLKRIKERNSVKEKTSLPVVTNAITHGLSIVSSLFVNNGEKIITPDKIWGNYKLTFQHAELDMFPTFSEGKFNVEGLKQKLKQNPGKQIVLLNFPNNPTGYSATEEDADGIINAIKESAEAGNKLVVICDDAYFGLFFENNIFRKSLFSELADLHKNILAIKLDGITKEMYSWGLRVGFITYAFKGIKDKVAEVLEDKTSGSIRGGISNVCTHSQFLAIKALDNPKLKEDEEKNFKILRERYEEVKKILSDEKYKEYFEALPFNSGYFMCIELNKDGEEVRKKLLKDYDTGVIAIGNLLRIAFSSVPKDKLRELFENIYNACKG
ncbi:MAG: aminotransferase class I/II-fold pyridoxal phosphate-dependent enzyme [Candidatus Aenigmarchaeota archaeon]|nr:aminotransferase class I/II-fold pyridoxal phosphate-dependent enzyme [Candidatus Aenigmarchaeota archaeon]